MHRSIITVFLLLSKIWAVSALLDLESRSRGRNSSIPAVRISLLAENNLASAQKRNSVISTRQDGSVVANLDDDIAVFASPVTVGGQNLNLILDTGSNYPWVYSSLQPGGQLQGHSYFNPTKSSTFEDLGNAFTIDYAGGISVTGIEGADTFTIGGTTVSHQRFGLANNVNLGIELRGDGVVGLGFTPGSVVGSSNFITNALPTLSNGLFAAFLPYDGIGAFDFGNIDNTRYTGDITYVFISGDEGQWQFISPAYIIEDQIFREPTRVGIPDTATGDIRLQNWDVFNYYLFVDNSDFDASLGAYTYPCSDELPDFSFLIGFSTYATIPGSDLVGAPTDADPNMCKGGIQESVLPYNIYGLPFFYNYYAIFDVSNERFGFASINTAE